MKIKHFFLPALIIISIFLTSASCRKSETVANYSLARMNWSERNYNVLNNLIRDYGEHGKYYDKNNPPYVVLDWDQTCAHLDVEEAMMHYQLYFLKFKMTKEQFAGILMDTINGITQLSSDYDNMTLAGLNQDIVNDYNYLYDNYTGLNGTLSLDSVRQTPQFNDFIAKVPFLYSGYCETTGIGEDYGYPWVLYLLSGYTIQEVKSLAAEEISYNLASQLTKLTWQTPAGFNTISGTVSHSFKTGLRVFPEMQNLIATFKQHGIDVFIVSASYKPVVEVFGGMGSFGYNIPEDHVIAMELATDEMGKILPHYKDGWIKTYKQGKVDAINQVIKNGFGKNWDPLFSAGDSDGDYNMLTGFPGTKLSLVWNRVKGGNIGTLCQQAVDEMNLAAPRYILQGRNENTGMVIPSSETILFGQTGLQLLHP